MPRLDELRKQILELAPEEFAELRDWLFEIDNRIWDEQIDADSRSGRLDALADAAEAELAAGKFTIIPDKNLPD